jgi:hypothetical protein
MIEEGRYAANGRTRAHVGEVRSWSEAGFPLVAVWVDRAGENVETVEVDDAISI